MATFFKSRKRPRENACALDAGTPREQTPATMNDNDGHENSINEFDFALICEYFSSVERQGPGGDESTLRALSFVPGVSADWRIADLGSGTGSSAILLAKRTGARVEALDLFPAFVEKLRERAAREGVGERVTAHVASMDAPPFADAGFELVWSEGAIYNVGFEKGLAAWRRLLKPGGFVAVTDAAWLTDERPEEIARFWNEAYPGMATVAERVAQLQRAGYRLVAAFTLPDACWSENFYAPQREAQRIFLERHRGNATAENLVANQRREAELWEKYRAFYGYVFFVAQKL